MNMNRIDAWTKKVEALTWVMIKQCYIYMIKFSHTSKTNSSGLFYHLVAVAMARIGRIDEARDLWKKAQNYLTGAHLVRENLEDLKNPVAQRHAPWAFSFGQWVTQKTPDGLTFHVMWKT
jgi:hypothetical protein